MAAFLTVWLTIRAFTCLLGIVTLRPFGWYRITTGPVLPAIVSVQ